MDERTAAGYGIDLKKGLHNCMGDESFYKTILTMFLEDTSFTRAKEAYEKKDYNELFGCTHEMKGVSGNTALTDLFNATVPLVETLRNNRTSPEGVDDMFRSFEAAYFKACEGAKMIISG